MVRDYIDEALKEGTTFGSESQAPDNGPCPPGFTRSGPGGQCVNRKGETPEMALPKKKPVK